MIRKATLEDLSFIVEEGCKFIKYHPLAMDKGIDIEYLENLGKVLITEHTVLISETDGKLQGMIAGILVPNFYTPRFKVMQELFWWVVEEYRNSSVAIKLLKQFEQVAHEKMADSIVMVSTEKTPTLPDFYSKLGYVRMEQSFVKEITWPQ